MRQNKANIFRKLIACRSENCQNKVDCLSLDICNNA